MSTRRRASPDSLRRTICLGVSLAIVALLALTSIADAQTTPSAGRVVSVQGRVDVERAGRVQAAAIRQELFAGDVVRTGTDGRVAILLADESALKVNADSTLRIRTVAARPARGVVPATVRAVRTLLELVVGETWLLSPPRPEGVELETPIATATIRGTEFNMRVAPNGDSHITVLSGRVDYRNALGDVSLAAGDLGIARRGAAPVRQVLVRPHDAVQWTLAYPGIYSFRDFPLVSADRARLPALLGAARTAAASAPQDLDRQAHVGELLHDLGRRREAREVLEPIVASAPTHGRALTALGWVALEDGRLDDAQARFTAVAPPTAQSVLGLSMTWYRRGQTGSARDAITDALRRFGPTPALLVQAALIDLIGGDVPAASRAIEEALRLDPAFALAHGLGSNIALTQNQKDEARSRAQRAVQANPGSPSAHLDLSLALQAGFDLDAALREARTAVDLDPGNVHALTQFARLLFGFDRVNEAWDTARRAQAIAPADARVLSTLGFLRLARGETSAATSACEDALRTEATFADAYVCLGLAAFRQGRAEDGLRAFQAAVVLEPHISLHHSYLAKALYQVGRRDEALTTLDRAVALDPRDPTPELYRAAFLRDLNRPVDAILAYQRSIALNDNRAIYRSRLLLDRDAATRNVNLALSYVSLGQIERALATGIRALYEDPQSSAAHLFYGKVIGLGLGAFQPGLSELLQTRILMPVNQNTFNTFNDYTMLLETPRLQGTLEGHAGSFATAGGSLSLTGGVGPVAGEQFLTYSTTDGPRRVNSDEESWASATFLKWAATPRSSAFVQLFHQELKAGDVFVNQRDFTANDAGLRQNADTTFLELGYQTQAMPESNWLFYGAGQLQKFRLRDQTVTFAPFAAVPGSTLRTSQDVNTTLRGDFYDVQSAYLHRVGTHQLWFAADYFSGEPETAVRNLTILDLFLGGIPVGSVSAVSERRERFHQQFVTLVAQDTWQVRPDLYLTGALRFDHARDGDLFSERRHNSSVLSPQGGLLWRVRPDHTLRAAAFQSFATQPHAVLSPTHIAGFFLEPPITSSSMTRQYHAAWDGDVSARTFLTVQGFHREVDSPVYETRPDGVRERRSLTRKRTGFSTALNQLVGQYVGASLGYTRLHRAGPAEHDGDDDMIRAGLNFVHPSGVLAATSLAWVHQDLGSTKPSGAPNSFWVLSVNPAYEFPEKRARLSLLLENVFGQRFDFQTVAGTRSDLVLSELPEFRGLVTLQINF